jgi:hypothetical protein
MATTISLSNIMWNVLGFENSFDFPVFINDLVPDRFSSFTINTENSVAFSNGLAG